MAPKEPRICQRWMVYAMDGAPASIATHYRADAIRDLTDSFDQEPSSLWVYWYNLGYRCIRVTVTPTREAK